MSERTISKALITQEDLALGQGAVSQDRQGVPLSLTKIDLPWVVTSLAALKSVNTTKIKHVVLDVNSEYKQYAYDSTSTEVPDDDYVVLPDDSDGRWLRRLEALDVGQMLLFATDTTLVSGMQIGATLAITDWAPFVGRTAMTLRNNASWPPTNSVYNVQTFVISTSEPDSGLGVVHYDLGGGHYAVRSRQGGGILIDWFSDPTSAPAMAAFTAFNVAGFSPNLGINNLINVTSTATSYTIPYWSDGLTIQFEPPTAVAITVTPTLADSKSVTFVLKNENVTLVLPGIGTFKGQGQRITALAKGTSGIWILQTAGSFYHPDGIIGDPLELATAGLNVTVGPTGSGADVIWAALDGLTGVKTFFINVRAYGLSPAATDTGLISVAATVTSTTIDGGTPDGIVAMTYKNDLADIAQVAAINVIPVPNANNGVLYTRVSLTSTVETPDGSASVLLRLIGYEY